MRVGKRSDSGAGSRRTAGVLVHHRWRRWAARATAAALRPSSHLPLDVVYARPLASWAIERFHTASEVVRVQPSIQLHLALAVANPMQTFVVQPAGAGAGSHDQVSWQPLQRSRVAIEEPLASTLRQQLQVVHHRVDTFTSRHMTATRLERTHVAGERHVTDRIEQVRHRSERVYESPVRVVHRRADVTAVRRDDQPAHLTLSRTRGRVAYDADIAARGERPPAQPESPPGFDLHRVTDEVVRQIDRRMIASRERMGRV